MCSCESHSAAWKGVRAATAADTRPRLCKCDSAILRLRLVCGNGEWCLSDSNTRSSARCCFLQEPAAQQSEPFAESQQAVTTAARHAVVGLSNLGNTCFFNSSVQLLLACAPLQQMLAQRDHDVTRGPLGFALQQAALHATGTQHQCFLTNFVCTTAVLHLLWKHNRVVGILRTCSREKTAHMF